MRSLLLLLSVKLGHLDRRVELRSLFYPTTEDAKEERKHSQTQDNYMSSLTNNYTKLQ